MKRLISLGAIVLVAATTQASPRIRPVKGMRYATYDTATHQILPTGGPERIGDSVWAATVESGSYYVQMYYGVGTTTLDWGDIAGPQDIGGFAISYATDDFFLPETIDIVTLFFAEENGYNTSDRVFLAGFLGTNLPTADPGGEFNGWTITFDLEAGGGVFTIDGSDLDFDGLVDFGYTYHFTSFTPSGFNYLGPSIAGDPNLGDSPGIEDAWDEFCDPNMTIFCGTWWFGGSPFAQFYMELFDANTGPGEGCPNPGSSGKFCTADIDSGSHPSDCIVDLGDLAQLLSNYGTTSGAVQGDGDVDPEGGDGDVDLGDLAELLSQYGDDCN